MEITSTVAHASLLLGSARVAEGPLRSCSPLISTPLPINRQGQIMAVKHRGQ